MGSGLVIGRCTMRLWKHVLVIRESDTPYTRSHRDGTTIKTRVQLSLLQDPSCAGCWDHETNFGSPKSASRTRGITVDCRLCIASGSRVHSSRECGRTPVAGDLMGAFFFSVEKENHLR